MCSKNLTNKKQQVWYTTDIVYIKSEPIQEGEKGAPVHVSREFDLVNPH